MNDRLDNPGILNSAENIWKNSIGIVKDIFSLFALEVKLAGRSIAIILVLVVLTSLLLLSSWFSLLGALITWLTSIHFSLMTSLLIVSAINLLIAIATGFYIVRVSNNLQFKETRKQLTGRG